MNSKVINKNSLLLVKDVYKRYPDKVTGEKTVLDDIDLQVNEGELCTVVGPSGCGKSTLLKLILGQEKQSSGSILINQKEVGVPNTDRGIVYQKYSLFPHLSVIDNVLLGKRLAHSFFEWKKVRHSYAKEAMEYLRRVNLHDHATKYPAELSGGMKQRAAIAQALIMRHKILMMDEPFGALDPQTREDMQMFLLELREQENMTVFFVTHDMNEAIFLGTRLLVLSQYYTDDRGVHSNRGAKIVGDYDLGDRIWSREALETKEAKEFTSRIRKAGFDNEHLQHVKDFNLEHPDSFQTLTTEKLS